jgi:hypothetical protein
LAFTSLGVFSKGFENQSAMEQLIVRPLHEGRKERCILTAVGEG